MKDKGKLFGKLNIIDLLVILLVVAAGIFFVVRRGERAEVPSSGPQISRIRYVVKVEEVDPEVYQSAKAWLDSGETQLIAGESFIDGNVVAIEAVPYTTTVETADGSLALTEDPYYLTLYCTMEAAVTNPVTMMVVSQETRVGLNNVVKTLGFCFTVGRVVSLEVIG